MAFVGAVLVIEVKRLESLEMTPCLLHLDPGGAAAGDRFRIEAGRRRGHDRFPGADQAKASVAVEQVLEIGGARTGQAHKEHGRFDRFFGDFRMVAQPFQAFEPVDRIGQQHGADVGLALR